MRGEPSELGLRRDLGKHRRSSSHVAKHRAYLGNNPVFGCGVSMTTSECVGNMRGDAWPCVAMRGIFRIGYAEILGFPELLKEYEAECSIPEIGMATPNPATYAAMERSGAFQCFGAFEDGELVGFATVLLSMLPHYAKRVAIVESIFAQKGRTCGSDLRSALKAFARDSGCDSILYSAPFGGRFERLLERDKGCRRTNSVFCESLTH